MTETSLATLNQRLQALENRRFSCPKDVTVDEQMRRARLDVEAKGAYSADWEWVPHEYYSWGLAQRQKVLGAPSTAYLCKSLLVENRKAPAEEDNKDPTNPRFMLLVLQYVSEWDEKKLVNSIRALRPVPDRLDASEFDLRIASEEDNARITGYENNAVVPFGMHVKVPIFLSSAIVPLRFLWMGGGHKDLKLRMAVSDFCAALNPIVAEISRPRSSSDPDP